MLRADAKAVLADMARKKRVQTEPRDAAQTLAQARAMTFSLADYSGEAPKDVTTEDVTLERPAEGGCRQTAAGALGLRLYRPAAPARTMLVWYHGGGAMAGSLDSHDVALRQLCAATGRLIASVDYRLAPEHVSPAPQEDCIAATRALIARAGEFGCDPAGVAIGGDSIGGLITAVVALALRDAGEATAEKLVMLYPNTDLRPDRPFASLRSESGKMMTEYSLAYENGLFVPDPDDRSDPVVSPLLAPDLSRLPPTLLVTCEHDPLRDEGEAFAARLAEAGVAVTARRLDGTIHGVLQMDGWLGAAKELRASIAGFLG
ncbi:alpha/beta hydrolase [Jiella avicenniae]|uniref:Alpha/beta hydrolase n=1 Tax=Jiella avicenniae TaxID=2907202 RepID=A0A9X1T6L0_9HYPH|nr:alpha/beta hydrolase [Jiella avicenniae]MCE7030327.1 alpha/beta hydrolase [Jiella avicenniae]